MKKPAYKNIHSHLFLAGKAIFRDGGEVQGSSESNTETGLRIEGLVEEWTRDGVSLTEIEKSIDRGDLSMKDLEKVIRILEEQEVDLDERMFQLTDELKEYVFSHSEAVEERELNEKAVALNGFQEEVKAGKYELALSSLWEIPDESKVAAELNLIAQKKPEALVPYLEDLSENGEILKSVLAAMQENASLDQVLSKAFVNFQVEEPYDPRSWFEKIGAAMKVLEQNKNNVWFDRPAVEKQVNEALISYIKRGWADASSVGDYILSAHENGIELDASRLKPLVEKALIEGLPNGNFNAHNWPALKETLDKSGIQLDMELLNKAVVHSIKNDYGWVYMHDFKSLQKECRDFKEAGFPLTEELLSFSESKEKEFEDRARKVAEIDRALAKKDYETVAFSLYSLQDDLPKLKSTVEVLLQNAPNLLVIRADLIQNYSHSDESWGVDVLKKLATRTDVGKILAEEITKKEYAYSVNLSNYDAFKEAGVVFNEAPVIAAVDARLLAEYEADSDALIPYGVESLMSHADIYHLPYDKDKVSYYANARLLEGLDNEVRSRPRYYLLTLSYEVKEMGDHGLKVDRDMVDEKVNTYIKNYMRKYADDPSSALHLDDLVKQAKEAGVKLDKEIFDVAR